MRAAKLRRFELKSDYVDDVRGQVIPISWEEIPCEVLRRQAQFPVIDCLFTLRWTAPAPAPGQPG